MEKFNKHLIVLLFIEEGGKMKKEWLVKTLALGIVVLFIGVSFQPSIVSESVTNSYDTENNCDCRPVSNKDFIKIDRNLDRLESLIDIFLLISKRNSEFDEIGQKLSVHFNDIKIMIDKLKHISTASKIICNISEMIILKLVSIANYLLYEAFKHGGFYFWFLLGITFLIYMPAWIIWGIFGGYCDWHWFPLDFY